MKKIFVLVVIASTIIACNNNSQTITNTTMDSVATAESPLMDAVSTADSAGKILHDSTHHMMDSSHKK